jgi:hypothetical protein
MFFEGVHGSSGLRTACPVAAQFGPSSDPATDQFDIFKDDAKLNTEARTRK